MQRGPVAQQDTAPRLITGETPVRVRPGLLEGGRGVAGAAVTILVAAAFPLLGAAGVFALGVAVDDLFSTRFRR